MTFWVRVGTTHPIDGHPRDTVLVIDAETEADARRLAKEQIDDRIPKMRVKDCLKAPS